MAGVSKRSNTFFRLSPVELGKTQFFGVKQGKAVRRLNAEFHQPSYRLLEISLQQAVFRCRSLSEICSIISDGTHRTPKYIDSEKLGVPFISVKDVREWEISFENTKFISEKEHKILAKRCSPEANDILLTKIGTIGQTALVPLDAPIFDIFVSVALLRVRKEWALATFITYFLNSEIARKQFNRVVKGVGVPDLHLEDIAETQVPLPPLSKQHELVAVMDEARSQRQQKLAEADALLSSLDDYLLDTIGLDRPVEDNRKVFAVSFSSINQRFDPHFHAPYFEKITRLIKTITTARLGELVIFSKETWKPKDDKNLTFRYIEISNVKSETGEAKWEEVPVQELAWGQNKLQAS